MGMHPGYVIVTVILLVASIIQSHAQIYTFGARNTSLQVDLASGPGVGISDWNVNGVNQLEQQWFYYSIGSGPVNSIDTLSPWQTPTFGGSASFGTIINTNLTATYASSSLSFSSTYTLQSQAVGNGSAKLGTSITIQNLSGTNETLHFYQYSAFTLGGVAGNQNVQFAGTSSPYMVTQTGLNGGPLIGTISATSGGIADPVEEIAGLVDGTQFGLKNGNPAPIFNSTQLSTGSGDVDFAYEIDATLLAGQSLTISEIQAVPEPSSIALISCGLLALAFFSQRRLNVLKKL